MWQHAWKCTQLQLTVEPGAQRSRAVAQPASGVATHNSQPQPHHTTLLSNFKRPHALASSLDHPQTWPEYRAWAIQLTPSKSGRIGALIPLNHTKTILGCLKPLKTRVGISDSHKCCPQWGLVLPDRPCHIGRCPTSCVELQGPGVGTYRLGDSARLAGQSAPKIGRPVEYGRKFTPTKYIVYRISLSVVTARILVEGSVPQSSPSILLISHSIPFISFPNPSSTSPLPFQIIQLASEEL